MAGSEPRQQQRLIVKKHVEASSMHDVRATATDCVRSPGMPRARATATDHVHSIPKTDGTAKLGVCLSSVPETRTAAMLQVPHMQACNLLPVCAKFLPDIAFVGALWWFLWGSAVDAVLQDAHWQRTINFQQYKEVKESGWNPPSRWASGVEWIRNEGTRLHHYEDRYETRWKTETRWETQFSHYESLCFDHGQCHQQPVYTSQPRTRKVSERVKVGEDPIYQDWFSWEQWKWVDLEPVTSAGNFRKQAEWPEHYLRNTVRSSHFRESSRSEKYNLEFKERLSKKVHTVNVDRNKWQASSEQMNLPFRLTWWTSLSSPRYALLSES